MAAVLDFKEIGQIVRGALEPGKLKLVPDCIAFKASRSGEVKQFALEDLKSLGWMRVARGFELKIFLKDGSIVKFDGFKEQDYHSLVEFSKKHYGKDIPETEVSLKGWNWGEVKFEDSLMSFNVDNRTAFEIPLQEVSQVSTGKNEVTLEFHQGESTPVSLLEMRFFIPPSGEDEDPVKSLYDQVMTKANVLEATGDAIAVFEELQVLTPRGRYDFTAYPTFIHLHGKTYDYKITYNSINRQFLLPHVDQRQMFFVFSLDPPLRQGQTRYPFVIMQFSLEEEYSLTLSIDEEECSKYGSHLQKEMTGPLHEVFSKVMRAMVGKKITVPGSFKGSV
jgi:structure-specific recognition protein 1